MANVKKMTAGQVEEAKALHEKGVSFAALGRRFSVNQDTVQRAVNPEFLSRRSERARETRLIRQKAEMHQGRARVSVVKPVPEEDFAARLAEIPPDNRSLTQRICGDPLPQRSALFRKQQALS